MGESFNAIGTQAFENNRRQFRIILAQGRKSFDDRNFGTQTPVGLRQLHADGPAANYDEMLRQHRVFKNGLVGEIGDRFKPRYRWNGGARTGGNYKTLCRKYAVLAFKCFCITELGRAQYNLDAEFFKACGGVIGFDGGNCFSDMGMNLLEIHLRLHG